MFHGSSFALPNTLRNSERFMASSDSRMDSSAGSNVSAAIRVTPMAMANGTPRSE